MSRACSSASRAATRPANSSCRIPTAEEEFNLVPEAATGSDAAAELDTSVAAEVPERVVDCAEVTDVTAGEIKRLR